MIGVEAGGEGTRTDLHAATLSKGRIGIFHGMKSYFLQDKYGQISEAHSISAGLDYPGVGPEHSDRHQHTGAGGAQVHCTPGAHDYLAQIAAPGTHDDGCPVQLPGQVRRKRPARY